MDGRWKKLIAGGVLCGALGCNSSPFKKTTTPESTSEPPINLFSKTTPTTKPFKETSSKSEAIVKDGMPIKAETLVALANVRLQAALAPDRSERDRDEQLLQVRNIYQQALKSDPKNLDAMLGMARVYKGTQDKAKCVEWYQRALQVAPNHAGIWGEMGQSLDGLKDRDAAISCYHQATKIDPDSKPYRKALGFALARQGRYEEGFAWLSRCVPPSEAHFLIARMMDHNGHHDLATRQFALAVKADPTNEIAQLALSNKSAPDSIRDVTPSPAIQIVGYEQPVPPVVKLPTIPNMPVETYKRGSMPAPAPLPASLLNR